VAELLITELLQRLALCNSHSSSYCRITRLLSIMSTVR